MEHKHKSKSPIFQLSEPALDFSLKHNKLHEQDNAVHFTAMQTTPHHSACSINSTILLSHGQASELVENADSVASDQFSFVCSTAGSVATIPKIDQISLIY